MPHAPAKRRNLAPEVEHDLVRDPRLGYEAPVDQEFVRCVEHGSPTPLERWHCHDEYELQLIVGARGQAFVGDYVGFFEPGHLVLTGPRLPHNWVSTDLPPDGLAVRSLVVQFREAPLRDGMRVIHELTEVLPLLERARHGIEFFGLSEAVRERFYLIRQSHGLERFAEFARLLCLLGRCTDYRLLSSDYLPVNGPAPTVSAINTVVAFVNSHYAEALPLGEMGDLVGMGESAFSRFFSKSTGLTFTNYVNRLRINRACQLLMERDSYVSSVCYAVGFNNVANFNRRFLEVKGMTPTQFRRQAAGRFAEG
ncbi:AraC family transcriptional regulator [Rhodoferax sp. WC2427]|uniref:AraC family transcriptional regulator n=1 Tax=Rhodoferax sp. WC2427 TaxID=3234144 RepID=UPI003466AD0C